MGGFNLRASAVTACILLILCIGTSGYTMEDMCQYWWESGFVGNPVDCQGWGYCRGNQLVGWGTCSGTNVFNAQTQSCELASTQTCASDVKTTCSTVKSAMYMADPTNCTQYVWCDGSGGMKYGSCPTGQVYALNGTCVWGPSCPQNNICRYMKNDIFVGDPTNCTSYNLCSNGQAISGQCPDGKSYNYESGYCQTARPTVCGGSGSTPDTGSGTVNVESPKSGICKAADTFLTDDTTCYGYYYCATATGDGVWGSCQTGTQFDPETSECVSALSYLCTYPRCGNLNAKFVAVLNTGCKQYQSCASGSTMYCPTDYPYFDEVSGNCVQKQPQYPICLQTTTST